MNPPWFSVVDLEKFHQNIVDYYDRVGEDYRHWSTTLNIHFGYFCWGMNPFELETMLDQMNLEVLQRLELPKGRTVVLDAGCGTGAVSRFMARRCPEAIFEGVNISPGQVDFGKKMNQEAGLSERVRLHEADFQKMPFPAEIVDAAFAIESACYAEGSSKLLLINELSRVIKPGGKLVIVDVFRKDTRPFSSFFTKIYQKYLSLWALNELADIRLFQKSLHEAGFENIQMEDITWNIAPSAAHIPVTIFKILIKRFIKKRHPPTQEQRNYLSALLMTLLMSFWKRHFGYFMVTCRKK